MEKSATVKMAEEEARNIINADDEGHKWKIVSPSWSADRLGNPFTVYPNIYFTTNINKYQHVDLVVTKIIHEHQHIKQQSSRWNLPFWLFKYFTSKRFRAQMEIEAFGREYLLARNRGLVLGWNHIRKMLKDNYAGAFTEDLVNVFKDSIETNTFHSRDWTKICKEAHSTKGNRRYER